MAAERKFRSLSELPELEGWLTFGEAAEDLDRTGERIRQMAQEGKFQTAHRLGRRPIGVIRESEVKEILRTRGEAAGERA